MKITTTGQYHLDGREEVYIFLRGRRHSAWIVPLMLWYVFIVVEKITTTGQSHLDGREEVDHQCKSVL